MHNDILRACPVWDMLSDYGRRVTFLTNGVLGQTRQAREKAYAFNATLGEARENGKGMYLKTQHAAFRDFAPEEVYPYAHPGGVPALRKAWQEKMRRENPLLRERELSVPVACSGLTHGLSLVGDLFLNPGDPVVLHDKHWENYELIFGLRCGGDLRRYPTFEGDRFHVKALEQTLAGVTGGKALVVLNFPNNPTGFMPARDEAEAIAAVLKAAAEEGKKLTVLVDDAYYGFWYREGILTESLFGVIAGLHENILAIRLDGATKEYFAGGLRLGFLTCGGRKPEILEQLEKKLMGAVRISVSSGSHFAQNLILRSLSDPEVAAELEEKKAIMISRGRNGLSLCEKGSSKGLWKAYPFCAGYFICLKVACDAEALRLHLLERYGMGVISLGDRDIRIAMPCLEEDQLCALFAVLDQAIEEVRNG